MAIFPSIAPTFNAVKSSQPAIKTVKFGDGYEQRIKFGLNQNPKEWSLTFMVNATDAATIENFLDARADDAESFDWRPPDGGLITFFLLEDGDYLLTEDGEKLIDDDTLAPIYKWKCEQWSKDLLGDNFFKISATFKQVYDL